MITLSQYRASAGRVQVPCHRSRPRVRTLPRPFVSGDTAPRKPLLGVQATREHAELESSTGLVQQRTDEQTLELKNEGSTEKEKQEIAFIDDDGNRIPVMAADYGFRSGSGRLYQDGYGSVPSSATALALGNFKKEFMELRKSVRFNEYKELSSTMDPNPLSKAALVVGSALQSTLTKADSWLEGRGVLGKVEQDTARASLTPKERKVLEKLQALRLDDRRVIAREHKREKEGRGVKAPWLIKGSYVFLCWVLDILYANRPIQRFWVLETVARMPYFAYISMLHLYESLGWWRAGAELRRIHFAEEWNELHHLQIMETLGGDHLWIDRFFAEHAAVFYYWVIILMFFASPSAAYVFSELVENHAVDTYSEFLEENKEVLQGIPPPLVAVTYYKSGDLYLFDALHTEWESGSIRRPECNNLYDVFVNIRDDELEHVATMKACAENTIKPKMDGPKGLEEAKDQVTKLGTSNVNNKEAQEVI
ncbi:PTOX1 [Auxenochlorella protothecoides x Auxenochlorella symbiontica]